MHAFITASGSVEVSEYPDKGLQCWYLTCVCVCVCVLTSFLGDCSRSLSRNTANRVIGRAEPNNKITPIIRDNTATTLNK